MFSTITRVHSSGVGVFFPCPLECTLRVGEHTVVISLETNIHAGMILLQITIKRMLTLADVG